jgi:hypothetical protein
MKHQVLKKEVSSGYSGMNKRKSRNESPSY